MNDFPTRIADSLELFATRVREMSVDRVRNATTWAAVGIIIGVLALTLLTYLLIALFRVLAELIGVEPAYLVYGGLFLIIGALLWARRLPRTASGADSRRS